MLDLTPIERQHLDLVSRDDRVPANYHKSLSAHLVSRDLLVEEGRVLTKDGRVRVYGMLRLTEAGRAALAEMEIA